MFDDVREPTKKEQQERFEECVPKNKQKTRNVRCKTPRDLANFLMAFGSHNVFLGGSTIKRKFPNLKVGVKRINEFMKTQEFRDAIREQIPEATREQYSGQFDVIVEKYFEGQMNVKRDGTPCPDAKAVTIFGQLSNRFDPQQKINITGGMNFGEEEKKIVDRENEDAIVNRIKRLVAEGKLDFNGGGNGQN